MADNVSGQLRKLISAHDTPVGYSLPLGDASIPLNPLLGKKISLRFTGIINCIHCGRKTNKSFSQGYCYPCFTQLAQCDMCIMKPEQCHHHLGTCREPAWGEQHCMVDHIVYLANSSAIKVGITRATQIPTRWIDQGATQALPIMRVSTRRQSGLIEVILKQHISDKTAWQTMLKGDAVDIDLHAARDRLFDLCDTEMAEVEKSQGLQAIQRLTEQREVTIKYPVLEYPQKVTSRNFEKTPIVEGVLLGIKGQYLILDSGVMNIRNFTAYQVEFSAQ